MILKDKGLLLRMITPRGSFVYFCGVIYCPKGKVPTVGIVKHESVHQDQQARVGWLKWHLLYFLVLPILWNPWRDKWEREAYKLGQGLSDEQIDVVLSRGMYGWLT